MKYKMSTVSEMKKKKLTYFRHLSIYVALRNLIVFIQLLTKANHDIK